MGVQRLRDLSAELSELFAALTPEAQTQRLLELLTIARESQGNRKPVLAAGRDGVTVRATAWARCIWALCLNWASTR